MEKSPLKEENLFNFPLAGAVQGGTHEHFA